jgi:D-3-phosphoglycerate dehydrogenase
MSVIVYDPYLDAERASQLGVELVDLKTVIKKGDVISLHVPLNEETRGLIGQRAIARMKKRAVVINASRGGVIDESALAKALVEGKLAGAALDVYEREPLPADSPLREAPNLVLTPHLGASTKEAQISVAREVALALKGALLEGDLTGAVNAAELA